MDTEYVRSRFIKHFDGTTGFLYASPGRINLIGEHTDYNGGFVFPGAVDKGMIANFTIHVSDKENEGILRSHFHVMTTMHPINPDGTWGQKQLLGICA